MEILLLIGIIIAMCSPVWAGDNKTDPPTYTVVLTVKYNTVSTLEAVGFASMVLEKYGDEACQVEITIEKNDQPIVWVDDRGTLELK